MKTTPSFRSLFLSLSLLVLPPLLSEVLSDQAVTRSDTENFNITPSIIPQALPQRVVNATRTFTWKVRTVGAWTELGETANPFWVTWGDPYGSTLRASPPSAVPQSARRTTEPLRGPAGFRSDVVDAVGG